MNDLQKEIYRKMPAGDKLALIARFFWDSRELVAAGLRSRHADWPEAKIQEAVRKRFLYARS